MRLAICDATLLGTCEDIYIANRNWANGGKQYAMHVKTVLLDCNFVVDSTNGNGLGIRNLKGPCVQAVYMKSTAPISANPLVNAAASTGVIIVQLADNYTRVYGGGNSIVSPASGSAVKIDNSALVAGTPYIITTVGNATAAQWQAVGLPTGITPQIGATFIAKNVGAGGNTLTSRVMTAASAGSGVATIEAVGDTNTTINPNPAANQGYGGQLVFICRDYAGAAVDPAPGTVIGLEFYLSDSSVLIGGE